MAGPQFTGGFGTSAFSAGSGNGIGGGKAATVLARPVVGSTSAPNASRLSAESAVTAATGGGVGEAPSAALRAADHTLGARMIATVCCCLL